MATNDHCLASIEPHFNVELFPSKPALLIAKWCVSYYKKFGEAPGVRLMDRFEQWAEEKRSKEVVAGVERLLSQLSKEFENSEYETKYLLDAMERYLQKTQRETLSELLPDAATDDEHQKLLEKYAPIVLADNSNRISFDRPLDSILEEDEGLDSETLIEFDGDLGRFFGTTFRRGGFVAFQAPEKTGKTFWLQELWYMCSRGRKKWNAMYVECGDLTRGEWFGRLASRASGMCLDEPVYGELRLPTSVTEFGHVEYRTKPHKRLNLERKKQALAKFSKRANGTSEFFRYSAGRFSAADLRNQLRMLQQQDGYVPDLIVIDYVDIMNHRVFGEGRDGINGTWIALRSIAMEFNCCVVTATQADAGSYGQLKQTRNNFSEDKRKFSHVSAFVGLNAVPVVDESETETDLFLLQWLARRHGRATRDVLVAGCLDVSRPHYASSFSRLSGKSTLD